MINRRGFMSKLLPLVGVGTLGVVPHLKGQEKNSREFGQFYCFACHEPTQIIAPRELIDKKCSNCGYETFIVYFEDGGWGMVNPSTTLFKEAMKNGADSFYNLSFHATSQKFNESKLFTIPTSNSNF